MTPERPGDGNHADDADRARGSTDGPLEDELEDAVDRQLDEGVQRLGRGVVETTVTGFFGGSEVAFGVLAMVAVYHETGSHLLGGLAFSLGFVALLLGHSELFTEGFLVPVVTVVAKRARIRSLLRLWGLTLAGNLLGGWLIMWLVVQAFPDLHGDLVEAGTHFVEAGLSLETFSLAVLAGAAITLLTRMQSGTDEMTGKIVAAVGIGFLLAGLQMFHSILDSLLAFGALHTGDAGFGYVDWAQWFSWTVAGNMVGGLGLVTLLRLVRSRERFAQERRDATAEGR
ncbi:Inner membrane protein YfdC [Nocardioides dokdonensis FR1436]|uniref:Inner membrane protein YfdC n=1 Tax=Nocardioides dokdonensis FR1436 TaxID=1300347 RepID=A0A1A9GPC2_9ACTN|nr:formate/nitrite transporter family protein [Nocardioides dokdonensis]ANH40138.1 Inner membrane protein YfdC [Nocardioides dokdonensis FR1436]